MPDSIYPTKGKKNYGPFGGEYTTGSKFRPSHVLTGPIREINQTASEALGIRPDWGSGIANSQWSLEGGYRTTPSIAPPRQGAGVPGYRPSTVGQLSPAQAGSPLGLAPATTLGANSPGQPWTNTNQLHPQQAGSPLGLQPPVTIGAQAQPSWGPPPPPQPASQGPLALPGHQGSRYDVINRMRGDQPQGLAPPLLQPPANYQGPLFPQPGAAPGPQGPMVPGPGGKGLVPAGQPYLDLANGGRPISGPTGPGMALGVMNSGRNGLAPGTPLTDEEAYANYRNSPADSRYMSSTTVGGRFGQELVGGLAPPGSPAAGRLQERIDRDIGYAQRGNFREGTVFGLSHPNSAPYQPPTLKPGGDYTAGSPGSFSNTVKNRYTTDDQGRMTPNPEYARELQLKRAQEAEQLSNNRDATQAMRQAKGEYLEKYRGGLTPRGYRQAEQERLADRAYEQGIGLRNPAAGAGLIANRDTQRATTERNTATNKANIDAKNIEATAQKYAQDEMTKRGGAANLSAKEIAEINARAMEKAAETNAKAANDRLKAQQEFQTGLERDRSKAANDRLQAQLEGQARIKGVDSQGQPIGAEKIPPLKTPGAELLPQSALNELRENIDDPETIRSILRKHRIHDRTQQDQAIEELTGKKPRSWFTPKPTPPLGGSSRGSLAPPSGMRGGSSRGELTR